MTRMSLMEAMQATIDAAAGFSRCGRWVLHIRARVLMSMVVAVCLAIVTEPAHAAIPQSERDALIALYDATNGGGWVNNSNWKGPAGSECTWFGVSCDPSGTGVVSVKLGLNGLVGTIPPALAQLTNLTELALDKNQLSGPIPAELGGLSHLTLLRLDVNQLSGPIPSTLGNLGNLRELYLWANQLNGPLPASLGNLSNLRWMALHGNSLSGPIPDSYAQLSNLVWLALSTNNLDGPIPVWLGDLTGLLGLQLDSCGLTGSIPDSLGNLTSLRSLSLDRNRLEGAIPSSLGALRDLTSLVLGKNAFVGELPPALANLTSVSTLNLEYNGLVASDPSVASWADARQPSWRSTQTIAPSDVAVSATADGTVVVSWTPIAYTGNGGFYAVWIDLGLGFFQTGVAYSKHTERLEISGLQPGVRYPFRVRTVTSPHPNNQNEVVSEFSPTVVVDVPLPLPTVSIEDRIVPEGDSGASTVEVVVTVTGDRSRDVSVQWQTADGTAEAGTDFVASGPSTLTIDAGTSTGTIPVQVLGDEIAEGEEVFFVNLFAPVNATIADGQGWVSIADDDQSAANPPDPEIVVEGCKSVSDPCNLSVRSRSGRSTEGWWYEWRLDGIAVSSRSSWTPMFDEPGAYRVSLAVGSIEGLGHAQVTLNVAREAIACPPGRLCMLAGRFEIELDAWDHRTGATGTGEPVPRNDIFGYFALPSLTGSVDNPEVFVKVLDGRGVNGSFWVFYGGLTDLGYTLRVRDVVEGAMRTYVKSPGTSEGGFDTGGGRTEEVCPNEVDGAPGQGQASETCATSDEALCLNDGRFSVALRARDPRTGNEGVGLVVPENDLFGYFVLPELTGNVDNPEVFVKIIDGREVNGFFWFFYGGLTDLEYTLIVTDSLTGLTKAYDKAAGSACGGFDADAF